MRTSISITSTGTRAARAVALSLLTFAPASSVAQTSDPPSPAPAKVLYACYVPGPGTVYRIKEPDTKQECTTDKHVMFSWTDGLGAVRSGDVAGGALAGTYPNPGLAEGAVTTGKIAPLAVTGEKIANSNVVRSVNGLTDALTLSAGANVTITPSENAPNTLTISAAGASGTSDKVPGWEVVFSDRFEIPPARIRSRSVDCPAGKKPLGGGWGSDDFDHEDELVIRFETGGGFPGSGRPFNVLADRPTFGYLVAGGGTAPFGWTVTIGNTDLADPMRVRLYVICASV
jgi:hypothetical protein